MESSFTVLRIKGIPIGAHWSWLFVFGLVVWSLATSLFPATYPGLGEGTYLVMGAVAGLLFFASILLHELGHAFTAMREGMKIEGITLWLFGGVARFSGSFPSPGAEFRIAAAGPAVSIAIAVVLWLMGLGAHALGAPEGAVGVADYLARINAIVVAFNLVPALPLDGGRILRSYLWHRQADFAAATRSATRAGIAFGVVLATVGILEFFTSGTGGGAPLWFVFLGWFLIQAAQGESGAAMVQSVLAGRPVSDFMTSQVVTVSPAMPVDRFLDEVVGARGHSTYPVVDRDRLVGMVSMRAAAEIPAPDRSFRSVADAMVTADQIRVVTPDDDMMETLFELESGLKRAPVVDDGRLVGFISRSDAVRAVEVGRVKDPRPEKPARSSGVLVWVVVAGIIVAAGAYLYHPPLVVLKPGTTLDVADDIDITGVPTDEVNGRYLLTSVRLEQPNGLGALAALAAGDDLVGTADLFPTGVDRGDYFRQQQDVFDQSRMLAAAAAAETAGMEVRVEGAGALVQDVIGDAPASGVLRPGDVIVAVDGEPIRLTTDLQGAIRSQPVGTRFELTVERGGGTVDLEVESTVLSGTDGAVGIGVIITTRDFDIDLPFDVDFEEYDIGGPSAGLVYALAITDILDERDIAGGKAIAATGTIDFDGRVGEVGGVGPKTDAVRAAGADLFLVPEGELGQALGDGVDVRGVSDLEEAVSVLEGATS
jgi:PDZ domain-containing secreted protein/Zn-dependent protease/CBS domain-containing protein